MFHLGRSSIVPALLLAWLACTSPGRAQEAKDGKKDDPPAREILQISGGHRHTVFGIAFSPHRKPILAGSRDRTAPITRGPPRADNRAPAVHRPRGRRATVRHD